jgi:predicted nuclease of restriction endonuclease-like (RecB) superfamily
MPDLNHLSPDYKTWISELKLKIRSTQIKAAIAVNATLIQFYWELGKMITEKQSQTTWGSKLLEQISLDLKDEFPDMQGFSVTNLKYCKLFYTYFTIRPQPVDELKKSNRPQVGDDLETSKSIVVLDDFNLIKQIPWGHIKLIINKIKNHQESQFYIQQTIENNWSRDILALQIKNKLFERQGKSITNFKATLPEIYSDLAEQTLKDPYVFDFIEITSKAKERDIENQMIEHIRKFLLELGKGFAFVGQQYHLEIADNDYYIDLLFYHIKLKCYVVIEIKNRKFISEDAGKLNFYLSAVDSMLKNNDDKPSIGLLLCRDKNNIEAEFSLRDLNKPIGISEFQLTEIIPDDLKSSLPTIEEIENELKSKLE